MAQILWPLFAFGAGAFGYKTGVLQKWSGFDEDSHNNKKNKNNNNNNNNSQQSLPQHQPPPQVIVYESNSNNSYSGRFWLLTGSSALLALGAYYYYIHKNGTKRVINKVEETAEQTQDLVSQSDKNNEKRFEVLDTRNTERAQTLETEIRSETRAGFEMVSEQLYCLTQVCIQTLTAIANGSQESNDVAGEFGNNQANNTLLSYADQAQEMADSLMNEETRLEKREQALQDIRADIYARAPIGQTQYVKTTPGGPNETPMGPNDDINNNINTNKVNIFDCDANQTPFLTNVSYKDIDKNELKRNKTKQESETDKGTSNKGFGFLENKYVQMGKMSIQSLLTYYDIDTKDLSESYENNKFLLVSAGLATVGAYGCYNYWNHSSNATYRHQALATYQNNNNHNNVN